MIISKKEKVKSKKTLKIVYTTFTFLLIVIVHLPPFSNPENQLFRNPFSPTLHLRLKRSAFSVIFKLPDPVVRIKSNHDVAEEYIRNIEVPREYDKITDIVLKNR